VLRRCVVNGDELINRLACCENAWDQLEAHKKKVQMIIQQSLNQIWRRDIERVQRQQHLVKEKLEEMKHLQKLAQQALKISQHLKPFAVQMAGIISVIDVRRTTLTILSPMEQICSEIGQIGMDSEIRVAAIDKEEKLRQQKIANSLANQALQNDAILALKNLKVVTPSSPKSTTRGGVSRQIVEVDRTRSDASSTKTTGSGPMPWSLPSVKPLRAGFKHQLWQFRFPTLYNTSSCPYPLPADKVVRKTVSAKMCLF
uniref:Uncharacterized protein n=1 Tax=Meloidogyne javanica TaxID=6303 RepID=A0A915MG11_MELJA